MRKNLKNKVVTVRMSDDDLQLLDARCDDLGMSRSEFIYSQIFTEQKRPKVDKEIKAIFRACMMILTSQINQDVRTATTRKDGESDEKFAQRKGSALQYYEEQIRPLAERRMKGYLEGYGWSDNQ